MILESIRDRWTNTDTYFWRDNSTGKLIGPYFDTEDQAQEWMRQNLVDGGDHGFDRAKSKEVDSTARQKP
jgi:hypothetical protein